MWERYLRWLQSLLVDNVLLGCEGEPYWRLIHVIVLLIFRRSQYIALVGSLQFLFLVIFYEFQ